MIYSIAVLLVGLTAVFAQSYLSPYPYAQAPAAQAKYNQYPQQNEAAQYRSARVADKDAHIVQEAREVSFDGSFNYNFNSENGIAVDSKGYIKPAYAANEEPIQVIEGSYSFIDSNGKQNTIHYVADENGYRAYGDGIPQPSEAILKSLPHRR